MTPVGKQELNKVDQHIKMCMLTLPTIFPSRMSVLIHLFIVGGNGYSWSEVGVLENPFDEELKTGICKMNYADLDEEKEKTDKLIAQFGEESEIVTQVFSAQRCRIERDYLLRRHIEQNIDTYAKKHVCSENDNPSIGWLKAFSPDYCVLSPSGHWNLPEFIDKEWALAGEEILNIAQNAIKHEIEFHSPFFKLETANPVWVNKLNQIQKILEYLDQFTGTSKRNEELLAKARAGNAEQMKTRSTIKPI